MDAAEICTANHLSTGIADAYYSPLKSPFSSLSQPVSPLTRELVASVFLLFNIFHFRFRFFATALCPPSTCAWNCPQPLRDFRGHFSSLRATMAAAPDVKRELELIENAEWRILSASADEEKLQRLLKVYLAPLLLKAGSEHVSVRNKVPPMPSPGL